MKLKFLMKSDEYNRITKIVDEIERKLRKTLPDVDHDYDLVITLKVQKLMPRTNLPEKTR